MCGRLSQYTGLHEFVDALSMPNALVNLVGEQPERYNVAPSTAVTTLRLRGKELTEVHRATILRRSLTWSKKRKLFLTSD